MKELSLYNFAIQYKKKFNNLKTNVLSRKTDNITDKSQISKTILQENTNDFIVYNK